MTLSGRHLPDFMRPYKPDPMATPPRKGEDGLYDRVDEVEAELIIYDHDREKGKSGISYADAIKAARERVLTVNLADDAGRPLVGQSIPGTARVDGPRLYALVRFKLHPQHKVEKLFCVRDISEVQMQTAAKHQREIEAVKADVVMAVLAARQKGASDADALAVATQAGVSDISAGLILQAIDVLLHDAKPKPGTNIQELAEQAAPSLAEAVKVMSQHPNAAEFLEQAKAENPNNAAPADPRSAAGSGVVTGSPGVNARITGECVAKLSPDGAVG